eukprot:scaffold2284_cov234-Chaetoceros_neogracile.AAC.5
MIFSSSLLPLLTALSLTSTVRSVCEVNTPLPLLGLSAGFDEPDWLKLIEIAFPPWAVPANGCPRLDKVGGQLLENFTEFPTPEEGKFNPCYYTKAAAGLDPALGGYPTPIDTHYHYEFAAPFMRQPGDGSTHHCPMNAPESTPIQSCPKVQIGCGEGKKDCVQYSDEYGFGHFPPFVALAALKNAYTDCESGDVCEWFDYDTHGCSIPKSTMDKLVYKYFGDDNRIEFQPPIIINGLPSSTYYRLEYINEGDACGSSCFGPHYCSEEVAAEDVWGDFCPYVPVGEKAGQYRHPHIALAAFELWLANKCMPAPMCDPEWLKSPNGRIYAASDVTTTSITWSEMANNTSPMSQPAVPYKWPNSGNGIFPGRELYKGLAIKPAAGNYVMEFVAIPIDTSGGTRTKLGLATGILIVSSALAFIC